MDTSFTYVVGSKPLDQQLEFRALAVTVDNPTNQWIRLDSLGVVIPQYTLAATYPLPGTTRAQASFSAPMGQAEPPIVAAQFATITFNSVALPSSAGVGMLGGRAPYYDRNPVSLVNNYFAASVGNHGTTVRWTYTVPAGRRAFLETSQGLVILEGAGDGALLVAQAYISIIPVAGGGAKAIPLAQIQGLAPTRTHASVLVGAATELQAGDVAQGTTANSYTATLATFYVTAKITEFDQ